MAKPSADHLGRGLMRISVDDATKTADTQAIETIVRSVMSTKGSDDLIVSVVRVKPDAWHVFIREDSPGQWSVLPNTQHQPLAEAIEAAIRKSGL